ncbi:hypothetical protein SAMN04488503_2242 [Humidesulfovibrio mexicanus]|uniref:Uncharacterized protein n=1 Tax=Humidesulfovibrio mexicanus TaxID=147047 RepID=A0A239AWZ1_9BACT|nr:hypothetical protein SAMN04488503_2242 [Humidesulfovibrio mexicanus]
MELFFLIVMGLVVLACNADRDRSGPSKAYTDTIRMRSDALDDRICRHLEDDPEFEKFHDECMKAYLEEKCALPEMRPPYRNRGDFECQEQQQMAPWRECKDKLERWLDKHHPDEARPDSPYLRRTRPQGGA